MTISELLYNGAYAIHEFASSPYVYIPTEIIAVCVVSMQSYEFFERFKEDMRLHRQNRQWELENRSFKKQYMVECQDRVLKNLHLLSKDNPIRIFLESNKKIRIWSWFQR